MDFKTHIYRIKMDLKRDIPTGHLLEMLQVLQSENVAGKFIISF